MLDGEFVAKDGKRLPQKGAKKRMSAGAPTSVAISPTSELEGYALGALSEHMQSLKA